MRAWRCVAVAVAVWGILGVCSSATAIDASNVLVLYNADNPSGQQIANYYAQVHPGVTLLGLNGITTIPGQPDDISADNYLSQIRPQVMAALKPSTDVIVTTTGLPLRVDVTEAAPTATWPNLPTYVDPSGTTRQILNWSPTSSLESELTSIKTVSSWQMMGDQSYLIPGQFTSNPYYQQTGSFSSATYGTYLTSRLDGYTVSDVTSAIDRAQHAFVGPNNTPGGPAYFMIDNDPTKNYAPTIGRLVNNVLAPAGLPTVVNNTSSFLGTAPGPVIAYDGFGANKASTPANYISSGLNITLADGAVFNSWESFNAQSFTVGGNHGNQGLIADWLAKGGTAGVGNVAEPGANPNSVSNEDLLISMLLSGKTFAEAAWSSLRQLSYVNTVVGDPLMTWQQLLPGDTNLDGVVNGADLSQLAANWGQNTGAGGFGWPSGDLNGDGVVDLQDLALMSSSWGQDSTWAAGGSPSGLAANSQSLPEPASVALMAMASGVLVGVRWRQTRRRAARR